MGNSILHSISVENYKAFEKACIPIKPITIFLGANSVGKSAIIQLLLLLRQTAKENFSSYQSPLKLYGEYVNLGSPLNLFRKMDETKPLILEICIDSEYLKNNLKSKIDRFVWSVNDVSRYIPVKGLFELSKRKIEDKKDFTDYLRSFGRILSGVGLDNFKERINYLLEGNANINPSEMYLSNNDNILRTYSFLSSLKDKIESNLFSFRFELILRGNELVLKEAIVSSENKRIVSLNRTADEIKVYSDFIGIKEEENEQLGESFMTTNPIFKCFQYDRKKNKNNTTLVRYMASIMEDSMSELSSIFTEDRINYVSPLRAHPKRYYMLDKANVNMSLDTLDGDAVAEVIKDKSTLKRKVNGWLKRFELSVDVEEFKEIIHHLKVKQNGLNLDISDVGFGISQVLPVIIQGFLSSSNSTVIMEQPEIHLHPKMQADLSDLFINIVSGMSEKRLVIETHSEYLLKRLRRRIAEKKVITNKDVSICVFHLRDNHEGTYIENLNIGETGFFNWPKEYYEGEIYNDTIEFLKRQYQ